LYVDPTVTSRPFPPITALSRVRSFDVNYENKTLIVVSDKQLKTVMFDNDQLTDLLTAVNASGLCSGRFLTL